MTRTGQRVIVQGLRVSGKCADVIRVDRVPHSLVFPRCATVVHHGGAGTTHAVISAGIPSVVVPHLADQFAWGTLLATRGIAPAPLSKHPD